MKKVRGIVLKACVYYDDHSDSAANDSVYGSFVVYANAKPHFIETGMYYNPSNELREIITRYEIPLIDIEKVDINELLYALDEVRGFEPPSFKLEFLSHIRNSHIVEVVDAVRGHKLTPYNIKYRKDHDEHREQLRRLRILLEASR
jgi:hypothetical protein